MPANAAQRSAITRAKIMLDEAIGLSQKREFDLLALDHALEKLAQFDPQQGRIVEVRFFGGLFDPGNIAGAGRLTGYSETRVGDGASMALPRDGGSFHGITHAISPAELLLWQTDPS